jgi:hypothetical protein
MPAIGLALKWSKPTRTTSRTIIKLDKVGMSREAGETLSKNRNETTDLILLPSV